MVLNARTGAVRELATVPASGYTAYDQAGIGVTEHHIVWVVAAEETGGAKYREVWSAPRDGGPAVRRARFGPDHNVRCRVAEVGGVFYAGVAAATTGPRRSTGSRTTANRRRCPTVTDTPSWYGPWAVRPDVGSIDIEG